MPELLLSRIQKNLDEMGLDKESKYGLAYSGGPDSTFLLYALISLGYMNLDIFYVNYNDSPYVGQEEKIVKDNVSKLGLKLIKGDVMPPLSKEDGNFEAVARKIRYSFFASFKKTVGFKAVFTAHQENDLVETYLMQKKRKGLVEHPGLSSLVQIEGILVARPLLNISKEEIYGYLNYHQIPYYEDITNENLERTRNRIRNEELKDISEPALSRILDEIKEKNSLIHKQESSLLALRVSICPYDKYQRLSEDDKLRLLYNWAWEKAEEGTEEKDIVASRNLAYMKLKNIKGTGATELKRGMTLYMNKDGFYISKTIHLRPYSFEIREKRHYANRFLSVDMTNPSSLHIDEKMFPLTVRNFKEGDTFGSSLINRSVLNFLKKQGVPRYLRPFYPVVISNEGKAVYVPFYSDLKERKSIIGLKGLIL